MEQSYPIIVSARASTLYKHLNHERKNQHWTAKISKYISGTQIKNESDVIPTNFPIRIALISFDSILVTLSM